MKITKEEFDDYENVRTSGVTNMFNVKLVCELSGLEREEVFFIMENYSKLKDEYLK